MDLTAGSAPAPIASTAGPEAMASGGVDTGTDPASPAAGEDTGGAAGMPADGDPADAGGAGVGDSAGVADAGSANPGEEDGAMSPGPILPPIADPGGDGPFDFARVDDVSGLSTHTLFIPAERGLDDRHPAVVWTCGNGGTVAFYTSFLEHLASHGFLVVADKASSSDRLAEVESQGDAIAWLEAENGREGGDFFEAIDLERIAVMGHSLGSLASFATAAQNPRVATSVHFSGGLIGNPVGFEERWLADMMAPAAFLCGGADRTAGPSCELDFEQAPASLPVFYGVLQGASHLGPFLGTPRAGEYGRAGVAWLRWQLAGDDTFASWFASDGCMLCSSPWTAQQRNLQ